MNQDVRYGAGNPMSGLIRFPVRLPGPPTRTLLASRTIYGTNNEEA